MQNIEKMVGNSVEQCVELLESDAIQGLSTQAAQQRLTQYGANVLVQPKKTPQLIVFLRNFTHLMALLLWVGGSVAFFAGMPQLGIAVYLVNVINGSFSYWQERQASKASEALKNMLPSYVRVVRDGQEQKIFAQDVVPGDIMLLEEGDRISADALLIKAEDLQIDQSTLTGESRSVRKNIQA
ncbi:MAG: cation-transporting P-type ATPase, partial [Culicoidibacterales bacterium]